MSLPNEHARLGIEILDRLWREVSGAEVPVALDPNRAEAIDQIFDGREVGYKKAIIIQVTGKAADFSLDAQSLQKGDGKNGAWDAREFGKKVFVKWNASAGNPLGDADDPYVSNQFRNPRFDDSIRGKRRNTGLFDLTLEILERANAAATEEDVHDLLREILQGVKRLLENKSFDYPIPQRASLEDTQKAVATFLSVASGGGRLQAVAHALFLCLSKSGLNYTNLVSRHVNASDAAGRSSGDVTFTAAGQSVAVEVKDRLLNEAQVAASVTKARIAEATELIFLVHGKHADSFFESESDQRAVQAIALKEFSSGLNIYWESFLRLSRAFFIVLGEPGRREFLKSVGQSLEEQSVDARHRWAWAQIVSDM